MVIVDGGKIVKCCPVECSKGTTIEVKSIFFNVPVRRKFQKSPSYDAAEICRIVTLLALANPEIKFQLISNQETIISAPAFPKESFQELLDERVQQILGNEFARGLCPLSGETGEYTLQGFLGLPASTKHNRTGQYLFINRRAVSSPLVSYAIREGYGTMLSTGRHPIYVLHLTMHGNLLDVNVHPQKREVRLRQEHVLKELIIRSVSDSLQRGGAKSPLTGSTFLELSSEGFDRQESFSPRFEPQISSAFGPSNYVPEMPVEPISFASTNSWPPTSAPNDKVFEELVFQKPHVQPQLFEQVPEKKAIPVVVTTIPRYLVALPVERNGSSGAPVLCLIDQRAAHARIMFDKLQQKGELRFEMQALLIPYIFDLPPADAAFLKEQLQTLQKVGLQIKEFGPRTFMIDSLPHVFGNVDIHQLIEEIIRNLRDLELSGFVELELEKKVVLAASRAAISGERRLELIEGQSLVDQLMECNMPDHCPSGKRIMLPLSVQQIATLFKSLL
jgi:DNA mismatch repair protein MutL